MKILFATPAAGGMVNWQYHLSTHADLFLAPDRLQNQSKYDIAQFIQGGYSGLAKDRGVIASFALRNGFDKLFMVDSDQSWKWEDCKKLLDSEKPIIGGMVALKHYPVQLNFTHLPTDKRFFEAEGDVTTPQAIKRWRNYNEGKDEMQVAAVGTGFVVIDVKVLAEMVVQKTVQPFLFIEKRDGRRVKVKCWDFFATGPIDGNYYGEDYGFCIQAARAGFSSWVNTSVEIPHHGAHTYEVNSRLQGVAVENDNYADGCDYEQLSLPLPENG